MGVHEGEPFVHQQKDGTWRKVSLDQVKAILVAEETKNLLILPTDLELQSPLLDYPTEAIYQEEVKAMTSMPTASWNSFEDDIFSDSAKRPATLTKEADGTIYEPLPKRRRGLCALEEPQLYKEDWKCFCSVLEP